MTYNWQFQEIYRLTDALAFIRLKSNLLHIWRRPENEALITLAFFLRNVFMPQIQSVPLEREGENN